MNKSIWTAVAVVGGRKFTKRVQNREQARRWWAELEKELGAIKKKWLE